MSYEMINDTFISNGEEKEFAYYNKPPMSKKIAFVSAVTDLVVNENGYFPMFRDMAFDFCLVNYFSNIVVDVSEDVDGDGVTIDEAEQFLEDNNAATVIALGMDLDVLRELNDSVDKNIEYKTGIHPSPIADAISGLLDTLDEKFAGVDMDAMTSMAKTFGKMRGDITPDKMLEAYAKSDVFKRMHKDVVKKQAERDKKAEERIAEAEAEEKTSRKKKSDADLTIVE